MALGALIIYAAAYALLYKEMAKVDEEDSFPSAVPVIFISIGIVIMLLSYFGYYVVYTEKVMGLFIY
jgi:hypothetical protein